MTETLMNTCEHSSQFHQINQLKQFKNTKVTKRKKDTFDDQDKNCKMTINSNKSTEKGGKLYKYWRQRYSLFSKFDHGIQLDDESWYSVTPENIAEHIAWRINKSLGHGHHLIVDGFCGVGGNLIQFAKSSPYVRVVGCDINADRIRMAKHNAKIYGVENRCEFILGDFMKLVPFLKLANQTIDAVFLSPPWGGVDYQDSETYSLSSMTPNGFTIMEMCRKYLTNNIAFLMPRNIDLKEVEHKLLSKKYSLLESEQNRVGKKVKTITVYFGDLVDDSVETESENE